MVNTKMFIAQEYDLKVYNGKPMIDVAIRFFTTDNCDGDEVDFDFPDYAGAYLRVFNERLGREIRELTLDRDAAYLISNQSEVHLDFDMYHYQFNSKKNNAHYRKR